MLFAAQTPVVYDHPLNCSIYYFLPLGMEFYYKYNDTVWTILLHFFYKTRQNIMLCQYVFRSHKNKYYNKSLFWNNAIKINWCL